MRIFRADVDIALGGAACDGRDRHAFDEAERIAFHEHAVGERAAVAFVGVASDVLLISRNVVDCFPLYASREAGAAATAQTRGRHFGDDVDRLHREGLGQAVVAAVLAIIFDRKRIGDAAARERQPFLILEVGNFFGQPVAELVVLAVEKIGIEKARNVLHGHRPIGDTAFGRLDFDERLQIKHAARSVADHANVELTLAGFVDDGVCDFVSAHRECGGVQGNEYRGHSAASFSRPAMISSNRLGSTLP